MRNACDVYNVCDVHVAFMYVMELLSILNNRRRLLTLFLGPAFLAAYYKAKWASGVPKAWTPKEKHNASEQITP